MDWITGISKAIDYIEEHITEPTDYARAAKEACSSPFNFQRVFALLCGYTLGDYVRMRRLTLAGEELLSTDAKVIDVALKYGYDSPESFSRAFTRFHGVSPSAVRKGAAIRPFSRICVKFILTGGSIMEYRIEKKQARRLSAAAGSSQSQATTTRTGRYPNSGTSADATGAFKISAGISKTARSSRDFSACASRPR